MNPENPESIAYFSMEIALDPAMPTYSGGLGMLAGDTLRSAADLKLPMVAVTLLHRKGYFRQKLDANGWQTEFDAEWQVENLLEELPHRANVSIQGRFVVVRAWKYQVRSASGFTLPVYLLDTRLPENSEWDRTLTDHLYGGEAHYRFAQEIVLGMGGVEMLQALGYRSIRRYHMNEGHASLLALELLIQRAQNHGRRDITHEDVEAVQNLCVFTTHTPVESGHDRFPLSLVGQFFGPPDFFDMHEVFCCAGELNMTYLALNLSRFVNGVAKRHGEISRQLLTPRDANHHYQIDFITNGVHLATWASPSFASLFDRHIPGWREDNSSLRNALRIPAKEIWEAHVSEKTRLIAEVNERTRNDFDVETLTLGFARRATAYKRANLLLADPERLKRIPGRSGKLQIIFAGKAHPKDDSGKRIIQQIIQSKESLQPTVKIVYLEDYDWPLARLLVAGVDVWLNTPQPPLEASGTSGMKAALNGVPSLSVLDGWWLEGCIEDGTGWAIGEDSNAASLYEKLERIVVPRFYQEREQFIRMMAQAIALNASHFNTQRMVQEYVLKAYSF